MVTKAADRYPPFSFGVRITHGRHLRQKMNGRMEQMLVREEHGGRTRGVSRSVIPVEAAIQTEGL